MQEVANLKYCPIGVWNYLFYDLKIEYFENQNESFLLLCQRCILKKSAKLQNWIFIISLICRGAIFHIFVSYRKSHYWVRKGAKIGQIPRLFVQAFHTIERQNILILLWLVLNYATYIWVRYSSVPNKRRVCNKRPGWKFFYNLLNVQDHISVQSGNFSKIRKYVLES